MAVAFTQTANPAGAAGSGNVTTYAAQAIGTATPDRVVLVLIGSEATLVASSVTIDTGSGARAMIQCGSGITFAAMGAWIFALHCPEGTTATIAVTWNGNPTAVLNHIAVYTATGSELPQTAVVTDTSTDMDATSPLNGGAITIPTGGGAIGIVAGAGETTAKTWTNLGEDLDVTSGTFGFRFGTAFSTTPGSVTPTCAGTTNGEDGVFIIAVFREARIPELVQQPVRSRGWGR